MKVKGVMGVAVDVTVDDHVGGDDLLVAEGGDFAEIVTAQFGRRTHDLHGPVPVVRILRRPVLQIQTIYNTISQLITIIQLITVQ